MLNKIQNLSWMILCPLISVVLGFGLMMLPLGIIFMFPLIPAIEFFDYFVPGEFNETGEHVAYSSGKMLIKTLSAFLFYIVFFSVVGFIFGFLLQITSKFKSQTKQWSTSLVLFVLVSVVMPLIFMNSVWEDERREKYMVLATPTESVFVCSGEVSFKIGAGDSLRGVSRIKLVDNSFSLLVGEVSLTENVFKFRNQKIADLYNDEINLCHNVDGVSISDLYTVLAPEQ